MLHFLKIKQRQSIKEFKKKEISANFYLCPPLDFRLHVSVYFRDSLVREVTTSSPDGCHITPCNPDKHYLTPGGHELVPLPVDSLSSQRRPDECPPSPPASLERGVLLWMRADGLYARRLCQSRVYWQGGPSPYGDKPNKLERDVTCKLLHTQDYLTGERTQTQISSGSLINNHLCSRD